MWSVNALLDSPENTEMYVCDHNPRWPEERGRVIEELIPASQEKGDILSWVGKADIFIRVMTGPHGDVAEFHTMDMAEAVHLPHPHPCLIRQSRSLGSLRCAAFLLTTLRNKDLQSWGGILLDVHS